MSRLSTIAFLLAAALLFIFQQSTQAETEKSKKAKKAHKTKSASAKSSSRKSVREKPPEPLPPAQTGELKYWSNPDYTRISLSLDRDVTWESHELGRGENRSAGRVYVDLNNSKLGTGTKDITIGDGLLKGVRVAQYKASVVRLVLDTENIRDYKIFPLSDPSRLVIDVKGERLTEISKLEESISAPAESQPLPRPEPQPAVQEKKPKQQKKAAIGKVRRIVVDPGHGGHDPGAVGPNGLQEKDVVLSMGLRLKDMLKEELGLDVVMTRSTDVFLPLEERTAIANKVNADLFISVHVNAAPNRNASGIETYYLNLAKTEKVAQLAAKENGTTLEKVSVLQAILFDLMANYKLNDSAHLAEEIQKSLHKKIKSQYADVRNLGVKQGPFYVLVGATMPSILVEAAFVSNAQEEARLKDPAYHELTASGVLDGVRSYIAALK